MANPISKLNAIKALYKGLYISANSRGEIVWKDDHETTAEETSAIDAKYASLISDWEAQEYARNRSTEYPPIGDQLDALYHAGVFPKEMSDKLKAVKDAHQKPSE